MNTAFEEVLASARMLPDPEKEELARILIADLGGEGMDGDIRAAWAKEAQTRYDAYLRDEISASPITEAAARVRSRLTR